MTSLSLHLIYDTPLKTDMRARVSDYRSFSRLGGGQKIFDLIDRLFTSKKSAHLFGDIGVVLSRRQSSWLVNSLASQINSHTSSLGAQAAVAILLPRNVSYC